MLLAVSNDCKSNSISFTGGDTLLSALSKEREEMKSMIRHENKELRQENTKLQQEEDKLRKRDELLQEQIVKLRDEKLQDENAQLKKEIEKLRHVNRRQRYSMFFSELTRINIL